MPAPIAPTPTSRRAKPALRLRLELSDRVAIGPGKADLLAAIRAEGSIAAAGRRLRMSYQRAHDLVAALNADFHDPLIETSTGGARGGGARLSPMGEAVLDAFRAIEAEAEAAVRARLIWLRDRLAP